jgi:hypothetical protein
MMNNKDLCKIFLFLGATIFMGLPKTIMGNNFTQTGPLQKVRINVVQSDSIPCRDFYTLQIISVLDPLTEGTATVLPGGFIEFMPSVNCRDTMISIGYEVSCNGWLSTDTLVVEVIGYNLPVNVIDKNISCYNIMPSNIPFGIREKFRTENGNPASGYCIDGFTAPLVGDLNGDGKPEIVMLGVTDGFAGGAAVTVRYILIYNGQDGTRMYRHNLGTSYVMGNPYHRSPAQIAIADLDNDGIGEIVLTTHDG